MSGFKVFGAIVLGIVAVGGIVIVGSFVTTATTVATAPGRVIQQTLQTDNIIHNYEWFRQQYADVQSMDAKISTVRESIAAFEASAGDRSSWAASDRSRWDFLQSQLVGLSNQRTTMVAAYNGNASKLNRSVFLAGLPSFIQ